MKIRFVVLLSILLITACQKKVFKPHGTHINGIPIKSGYTICVTGDTGYGNPGQYKVAIGLSKANCDEIRIVGDLIYEEGFPKKEEQIEEEFQAKFYRPYNELLKTTPFYLAMGNHDHRGRIEPWVNYNKNYKNINFPGSYYSEKRGNVCIITIDDDPFKHKYGWNRPQFDWISSRINVFKRNCGMIMMFGHHPYIASSPGRTVSEGQSSFVENFVLDKVDMYIAGHEHHMVDHGVHQNTQMFTSGAGSDPRPVKDGFPFAIEALGFVALTFTDTCEMHDKCRVDYAFYTVEGDKNTLRKVHTGNFSPVRNK